MQAKYDQYSESSTESSGSSTEYENIELRFTPFTTVHVVPEYVFGSESEYGQSLGVRFRDVRLQDGALYVDPEKEVYKLFSWESVAGLSVPDMVERGMEPTADDAPEVETKDYAGNKKTYELVAARVPEGPDVEASSKERSVELEDGEVSFGEWEDLGGEPIKIPETITWYNGSDEYGPSAASKSMLETLTRFGSEAAVDEDDLYNWLPDTSGDNLLREDLEDRQLSFFTITRESENGFVYHDPILEDLATEERVTPNNRSTESESDEMRAAREADSGGTYPEPVADFISSGKSLNLNEDRANNLLDELLGDSDNSLTEGMLEDAGGREVVINEVI